MDVKRALLSAGVIVLSQWTLPAQAVAPPQYQEQAPFELSVALGTTGDWKAVVTAAIDPGSEIESNEGASQSRICFVRTVPRTNGCTYFADLFDSKLTFQTFSSLAVERLRSGSPPVRGLVMKAAALYPTGQVSETAIWIYDPQQDRFHLVAAVEPAEVHIFNSGPLNGALVTANWHRDEGESRWSDHRRDITVYRYSADVGRATYRKVLEYTTTKKYGAEDTSTIDAELTNIEAKTP